MDAGQERKQDAEALFGNGGDPAGIEQLLSSFYSSRLIVSSNPCEAASIISNTCSNPLLPP